MAAATASPCSESPVGLAAVATLSQNLDMALRGSPLVDAALTLQYVQPDRVDGGDGYPAPGNEYTTETELARRPESPRQSIARGQRRKQEQQHQRAVGHKKQEVRSNRDEETYQPIYCRHCNRTETVKWRQGPDGVRTLCNVCGLLYAKRLQRFRRQ